MNGLPFLHTNSPTINFLAVQSRKTRNTQGLQTVTNIYTKRGFILNSIFGDNGFNIMALHYAILPTAIHIFAVGNHCSIVERLICSIKERCGCICHLAPHRKYTKLMVYSLIDNIIYWLSSFLSKVSASQTISPADIITGWKFLDFNNKLIPFGAYTWVYTKTTNIIKSMRVLAIALAPSNE